MTAGAFEEPTYDQIKAELEFDPEMGSFEVAVKIEAPASEVTYDGDMETLEVEALTAADRCDRCGAQAYLRVTLMSGGELLFCAHHAREHGDKLREIASSIHDETASLSS